MLSIVLKLVIVLSCRTAPSSGFAVRGSLAKFRPTKTNIRLRDQAQRTPETRSCKFP
jgi:hypothetical protein